MRIRFNEYLPYMLNGDGSLVKLVLELGFHIVQLLLHVLEPDILFQILNPRLFLNKNRITFR